MITKISLGRSAWFPPKIVCLILRIYSASLLTLLKSWCYSLIICAYLLDKPSIQCVLGKYFSDFEIPSQMKYLWHYMYHMYQLDAFTQSCPADQDIINHYKLQQVSLHHNQLLFLHVNPHNLAKIPTITSNTKIKYIPIFFEMFWVILKV